MNLFMNALSLSLMGCNVMFSVSVSEVQAVFPEPVTREEFSQCKLDIKTCKLSHTHTHLYTPAHPPTPPPHASTSHSTPSTPHYTPPHTTTPPPHPTTT